MAQGTGPHGPGELRVEILGQSLRVHTEEDPRSLERALEILEGTFQDMARAYELRWNSPPAALDTSTWVLMGALNLAHRVARLEQEAAQHTQDLEQTLSKLLDDVPDEPPAQSALPGSTEG